MSWRFHAFEHCYDHVSVGDGELILTEREASLTASCLLRVESRFGVATLTFRSECHGRRSWLMEKLEIALNTDRQGCFG
jgi:hypothetical protein